MNDTLAQRSKLEAKKTPVAIIHSGLFVFANQAYLDIFGFDGFEDLEATTLLDLVNDQDQEKIKLQLHQTAIDKSGNQSGHEKQFAMQRADGSELPVNIEFNNIVFDEEDCIQISVRPASQSTFVNFMRSVSWGYYLSIIVLLFLSSLPNLLLLKLNINNSPVVFFPADEPAVVADDELREYFPTDQVIVFLFEGVALYSDGFLNAYNSLAEQLKEHPKIQKVMSVTTQDHISGSAEGFSVTPLIDVEELDDSHPRDRKAIMLSDRFARGSLVSETADAIGMVVIPQDVSNSILRMELLNDIKAVIDELRLSGYVTAMAGEVPMDVAQIKSMLRDNMIFIPLTTAIGLLLIWLLFHRLLAVFISGAVIGVIVSTTIAIYVVVDQPFTLIASITPPLLTALTIAVLVHLFNAVHYEAQRGKIGRNRIQKAVSEIKRPALYATLTTSAGLASLGLSPIPAIASFGLIASFGVLLIFLIVIFVVPQILIRWDFAAWPARGSGLQWMDNSIMFLTRLGLKYPVWVLAGAIIMLGSCVPLITNIKVETNLQEFFSPDHEIRRSTDHIDKTMVGTTPLDVVFKTDEIDALKSPENLQQIKKFQQWADSLNEVDNSASLTDFIEEMNWGFNEEQDEFRSIPDNADLISQYLLVYDGNDLYDLVDQDFQITRVSLNLNVHSANDIGQVIDNIRAYLNENIENMDTDVAGIGRLFSDMEVLLIDGQVSSLGGALVLIFVLMLILWRSLLQSLICMIPNLSPILLIFIFMGIFNIWLDMATAMIASVAVGIAVDDTIHMFHAFIKRVKKGSKPSVAMLRTTAHAGRAIMTTTVILSSQFLILLLSEFIPTNNFGLLTSIGLLTALLFDLIILPAILILVYRKYQQAPKMVAEDNAVKTQA